MLCYCQFYQFKLGESFRVLELSIRILDDIKLIDFLTISMIIWGKVILSLIHRIKKCDFFNVHFLSYRKLIFSAN